MMVMARLKMWPYCKDWATSCPILPVRSGPGGTLTVLTLIKHFSADYNAKVK
jgi:hypothetical protein